MRNRIVSVVGPTASGKTELSIEIANKFNCEILSTDSRQLYRELNIGVAKPSDFQLSNTIHHFIGTHSIEKPVSAGQFGIEARDFCKTYFEKNSTLVLVGGSNFYSDALTEGLDDLPTNLNVKNQIESEYEKYGLSHLQSEINQLDSNALMNVDLKNPRRLIRILEILRINQHAEEKFPKISSKENVNADIFRVIVDWKRQDLYDRINSRVDKMLEKGLLEEVKGLIPFSNLTVLKTVGYSELFDYFEGKSSLNYAIDKIKQHTRNYAKRQMTWLNRYPSLVRLDPYRKDILIDQFMEEYKKWNNN